MIAVMMYKVLGVSTPMKAIQDVPKKLIFDGVEGAKELPITPLILKQVFRYQKNVTALQLLDIHWDVSNTWENRTPYNSVEVLTLWLKLDNKEYDMPKLASQFKTVFPNLIELDLSHMPPEHDAKTWLLSQCVTSQYQNLSIRLNGNYNQGQRFLSPWNGGVKVLQPRESFA